MSDEVHRKGIAVKEDLTRSVLESDQIQRKTGPIILTFFIMFAVWIVLSGKFDLFHMSLGAISCFLVSFFSSDLLFSSGLTGKQVRQWIRFLIYIPWLLLQILLSNLHVLYLVLHPRMKEMIDPRITMFSSGCKNDIGRVVFANSITLTPGTITVYVSIYGDFSVHSIDYKSREPLPGDMEARIMRIFN